MTIYNIVSDFYALKNIAEEAMTDQETGEVRELTDEEKSDFLVWLEENEQNLETKMNGIYKAYRNKEAEAAVAEAAKNAMKDEMDRQGKRAKARNNEANRIKNLFAYAMDRLKMKKYKTNLFSIGWQATRKCAKPVDGFFDADKIPTEYLKRELSPSAIDSAVKEGRLYQKDDPLQKGSLFYLENGIEKKLEGVSYLAGEALVLR